MSNPARRQMIEDRLILQGVIEKWRGFRNEPRFSPTRFEKSVGLKSLPNHQVNPKELDRALQYSPLMKYPKGKRFSDQIDSLLTRDETILPLDIRKQMVYFLSRVVHKIPEHMDILWNTYPTGLDYFSTALFTLLRMDQVTGSHINWLSELSKPENEVATPPDWEILTLRPDGPLNGRWRSYLNRLRTLICSLRYQPLRRVCEYLANLEGVPLVSRKLIADICEIKSANTSRAKRVHHDIGLLITERFLPSLNLLGLRYRFILHKRMKTGTSSLRSLCEIKELASPRYKSITLDLEPATSQGPSGHEFDVCTEKEVLSLRMDFFDPEKGVWELGVFSESHGQPEDIPEWLYLESTGNDGAQKTLTPTKRNILCVLWTHRGSQDQRNTLFDTMDVPWRTRRNTVADLTKEGVLQVMFHPSLEYLGLPDGTLVVIRNASSRELDDQSLWLMRSFPYVHLYRGKGTLVGEIRLPEQRANFFASMLDSRLKELDVDHFSSRITGQRTFYMTVLSRLYSSEDKDWMDTWK